MGSLMQQPSKDRLFLLSEEAAARTYLDSRNCRVLFRLLVPFTAANVVGALVMLALGRTPELLLSLAMLVLIRMLYALRDRAGFSRRFRPVLLGYLAAQLVLLRGFAFELPVTPFEFLLPFLLLFFRLRWPLLAVPLAALWAVSAGRYLLTTGLGDDGASYWVVGGQSAVALLVLAVGHHLTVTLRRGFVDDWRRESRRFREQRRMRAELGDARKMQLSMLPRSDPESPWLDIAGISIPASEVGGDYYDYFRPAASQQAVVVADVAGHGMASGLILSGIRSCLHLLHETPMAPVEILSKLDRMVRETTADSRYFVTMLYALFDGETRSLTISAAGHPSLLHYRAHSREVRELDLPSLPLGTGLKGSRQQRSLGFEPEDIALLYTDGIAEILDSRGELYGYDRLSHRLRTTAHDRRAKEIRDTLLGDIVAFKGDCEQTDDITLVVVKAG